MAEGGQRRSPVARWALGTGVVLLALLAGWLPTAGQLGAAGRVELGLVVACAGFWILEVLPGFAVALLAMVFQAVVLGWPGGVLAKAGDMRGWEAYLAPWASPTMWLFLGGLFLGAGAERCGVDRWLAVRVLSWSGGRRGWLVVLVLLLAFGCSMLLSNTATAAMLVVLLKPVVSGLPESSRTGKCLMLAVAVGANVGGMATVIGTPPNVVAAGLLSGVGKLGFVEWLGLGLPVGLACVVMAGWWLTRGVGVEEAVGGRLELGRVDGAGSGLGTVGVVLVTLMTVGLWATEAWHGLQTGMVALLPLVVFPAMGIVRAEDLQGLPWDVLLLLAGGLSLGVGIERTGLAVWVAGLLGPGSGVGPGWGEALVLCWVAAGLSTVMSNTAAANILLPIAMALGQGGADGIQRLLVVATALGCSLGMALPISTPPNALVQAGGRLGSRDYLPLGLAYLVLGPPVVVGWCAWMLGR